MHYRAFLSYSHTDEKWARWLMHRLEGYRVPANLVGSKGRDGPIPAKLGKFFRDRDELPSAGNLSKTINDALEKSHALIVICSPSSAQSQWVNAEIDAFREKGNEDTILSFIVDGDPASRAPGVASFPYTLIKPESEGGPEREPLAADARKQGDGRERAFIKLVAGLLGVGFDDLAQREAQQRHRRMAIITGASLLGMTLAVVLAVTAYIARNDAERRQGQAEDILGFMLGDLRKNLTKVGRLDLMRSVDDKATGYFATLNPRDLSDRALEEQARSLYGIGEVRVNEGKNEEAMAAFRESHARSTALYERAPKNGQRLFDLAQAEYWIGYVAWQQGRFDDAKIWLTKYRDSGIKLAAMDRMNFAWQKEAAYGYQNLATLDKSLGRNVEAERAVIAQRELYVSWLKQYPKNVELRYEDADNAGLLGLLVQNQGKLREAEMYFGEQVQGIALAVKLEPDNVRWQEYRVDSLLLLHDAQRKLGYNDAAKNSVQQALFIAEALHARDTTNTVWMISLASCYLRQALFDDGAAIYAEKAVKLANKARAKDGKNEQVGRVLAAAWIAQCQLALKNMEYAAAFSFANKAADLIEPFWQAAPNETMRLKKSECLTLIAEAYLQMGERKQAEQLLNSALQLLMQHSGSELPFARLDNLVRVMHLLGQKEQAKTHRARLQKAGFVPTRPYP